MQRTNEHYLPRFLMRGFASLIGGDDVKTWWFRQGMKPEETNIKNIAAEKDFHSSLSGSSADDSIKPLEDHFGWYVDSLRRQTNQSRLDDAIVPELIANLTGRTKAFREEMTRSMTMAMRDIIARFRDPECLNKFASKVLGEPSYGVLNALASKLAVKFSPEYAEALIKQLLSDPNFLRSPIGSLLTKIHLEKVEKGLESDFPQAARESHVYALSRAPVPESVIEAIAHLHWHLVICNRGSFILGDVGPVFKIENRDEAKSAPIGVCDYDAAFLPISDSHLLVGLQDVALPDPSVEQINRFSCSCSKNFFISASNSPREEKYTLQLGSTSEFVDKNTLDALLNRLFGPN
jgi:hypothetical protein